MLVYDDISEDKVILYDKGVEVPRIRHRGGIPCLLSRRAETVIRYNGPNPCMPNASTLSIASVTNVHRAAMEKTVSRSSRYWKAPSVADEWWLELTIEY